MKIRFVSNNRYKITEVTEILAADSVEVIPLHLKLEELQTEITEKLIADKVLKAFNKVGRPLIVEHTGLYLESLNGFPGGLTQLFWDQIQADRFSSIFGALENRNAEAKTIIGYCDGKDINYFSGRVKGTISPEPKGDRSFQWDCVFVPDGHKETFAQMGDKKNEISMRQKALSQLIIYLKKSL